MLLSHASYLVKPLLLLAVLFLFFEDQNRLSIRLSLSSSGRSRRENLLSSSANRLTRQTGNVDPHRLGSMETN